MTFDPFRPTREPWRSIYDAFQAEATQRHGRSVTEWIAAEEQAVLSAATQEAKKMGWPAPDIDMVRRAETYARGSVDYALKWSAQIVRLMQPPQHASRSGELNEMKRTATGQ